MIALPLVAALAMSAPAHSATASAVCHARGSAPFTTPDNAWRCTPGDTDRYSRQRACTPGAPRDYPVSVRRDVLARYGVPNWSGRDGEIDHRVPNFLGGKDDRRNLWPERGSIPNPKDRLEQYVYHRVCARRDARGVWHGTMRPRTARRIFLSEWQNAYERYIGPIPGGG